MPIAVVDLVRIELSRSVMNHAGETVGVPVRTDTLTNAQ
jgi:hypothetical protein